MAAAGSEDPVRVGIDVTSLLDAITGIGTFVHEAVEGLAARPDVDLHAFAVTWRGRDRLATVVPRGACRHVRPLPARVARLAWARSSHPSARLLVGAVDVVHGPNFVVPPGGGAAEVATVHDLTALHHPEMCTADVLEWPHLLRRALRRGAWVHTVSSFVADELADAFPEAAGRIVVVPNGVRVPPPADATTDAGAGHHLAGGERYVLAVGTIEPRKHLVSLIAAFESLADGDPDLRLVVAGGDGLGAEVVHAAARSSRHSVRISMLGRVDGASAPPCCAASVVAYPSLYEGFGLVPLDAMAVGTPVVATAPAPSPRWWPTPRCSSRPAMPTRWRRGCGASSTTTPSRPAWSMLAGAGSPTSPGSAPSTGSSTSTAPQLPPADQAPADQAEGAPSAPAPPGSDVASGSGLSW
ncbi:MAG: glycosyltransferase [Acidimicrobiales bacterium]